MRILNAESRGYSPTARSILSRLGEVVDADLDQAGLLDALGEVDVVIVRLRKAGSEPRLFVQVRASD